VRRRPNEYDLVVALAWEEKNAYKCIIILYLRRVPKSGDDDSRYTSFLQEYDIVGRAVTKCRGFCVTDDMFSKGRGEIKNKKNHVPSVI